MSQSYILILNIYFYSIFYYIATIVLISGDRLIKKIQQLI